jgi:hypothetical protein
MEINNPKASQELTSSFMQYERALCVNNYSELNLLFFNAPTTVRYGSRGENQYGYDEISYFRRTAPPIGLERTLARTLITTYGQNFGVASTLYYRADAPGKVGRQMQTWLRAEADWRIVSAHVSLVDRPDRTMP